MAQHLGRSWWLSEAWDRGRAGVWDGEWMPICNSVAPTLGCSLYLAVDWSK